MTGGGGDQVMDMVDMLLLLLLLLILVIKIDYCLLVMNLLLLLLCFIGAYCDPFEAFAELDPLCGFGHGDRLLTEVRVKVVKLLNGDVVVVGGARICGRVGQWDSGGSGHWWSLGQATDLETFSDSDELLQVVVADVHLAQVHVLQDALEDVEFHVVHVEYRVLAGIRLEGRRELC